jgi:hypothetical protein
MVFNDQLGLKDIFYYNKGGEVVVSDKFVNFFSLKEFSRSDLDLTALSEFLLIEHVLLDRTFVKDVKLMRYASIMDIRFENEIESKTESYWRYHFTVDKNFDRKEYMKKLDQLFRQAIRRIHMINGDKQYLIGLSGGLDSRLVLKYALQEGLEVKAFIFNNKGTDAIKIAKKLAKLFKIPLSILIIPNDFYYKRKDQHLEYDPMMNIMYTAYGSIIEEMPKGDVMLSGNFGNQVFGDHVRKKDISVPSTIIESVKEKFFIIHHNYYVHNHLMLEIEKDITKYENINRPRWQQLQIFDIENRQLRFVKNAPQFNYYGLYEINYSILSDIDVVEFLEKLPVSELFFYKFYNDFLIKYHPELASVRPERKPYNITDSYLSKKIKIFLLRFRTILENRTGIRLPIFNSITFRGQLDWVFLLKNIKESEFKKTNLNYIYEDKILSLNKADLTNTRLLFHYLTIQKFIERYIK